MSTKHLTPRRVLTPQEEVEAVRLHESGLWVCEIRQRLAVPERLVAESLRRLGCTHGRGAKRTYPFASPDYFAAIDTEPKAYWLGFLAGDGTMTPDGPVLKLARVDRGHVVKFATALGYGRPIRDFETEPRLIGGKPVEPRPMSRLDVYSRRMAEDLERAGVGFRKSGTLQPWAGPPELARHWWRGLYDADGGWVLPDNGAVTLGLVCSPAVAPAAIEFIGRATGYTALVCAAGRCNSMRDVRIGHGVVAQEFARVLYDGATVWLDRKREKADGVLARTMRVKKVRRPAWTPGVNPASFSTGAAAV